MTSGNWRRSEYIPGCGRLVGLAGAGLWLTVSSRMRPAVALPADTLSDQDARAILGVGANATPAEVQAAADRARAAFPDWADRPRQDRIDAVKRYQAVLKERAPEMAEAIMVQGRRDPEYISDPDMSQYLENMGRKLGRFAPGGAPQIEVFGVRNPEVNAFAMPGGFIGVDIFYVISGYLITGIIIKEITFNGTFNYRNFFLRRAKRLLPASISVLILTAIGAWLFPWATAPVLHLQRLYHA